MTLMTTATATGDPSSESFLLTPDSGLPLTQWKAFPGFDEIFWKFLFMAIRHYETDVVSIERMFPDPTVSHAFETKDMPSFAEFSPGVVKITEISSGENVELRESLRDLDEVALEAQEEELEIPSKDLQCNVRQLLKDLHGLFPQRFEVYPMPGGEIAIHAQKGQAGSVVLTCEPGGSALCSVNMNGDYRQARYADMSRLPDGFVREALDELENKSEKDEMDT